MTKLIALKAYSFPCREKERERKREREREKERKRERSKKSRQFHVCCVQLFMSIWCQNTFFS